MTKTPKWLIKDQTMVAFDFKRFLTTNKLTAQQFASLLNYTTEGVVTMIKRGTIKLNTLKKLEGKYAVDNYISEKARD